MSTRPSLAVRLGPLVAALVIVLLDQISKALIVANIPVNTIGWAWGGDFFWLVHQRNIGVAFSLGNGLPDEWRQILFVAIPLLVLVALGVYVWIDQKLTPGQRWALGLILGGGLGNIIDRAIPPGGVPGVVDFLSFRLYGFLGMERFATFNLADSAVTVGGALLVLTLLWGRRRS